MPRLTLKPARLLAWFFSLLLTGSPAACWGAPEDAAPNSPDPVAQWGAGYKADVLHISQPSLNAWVGHLSLHADVNLERLWSWSGSNFHVEGLFNHGSRPNQLIGSTQGVSNLEVAQGAARLYATWIEKEFKDSRTRLLFGLYDLNSEFYVTEASAQLINPSFGIGVEASQSGQNGPSVFPHLGLGLRLRQSLDQDYYLQAALLDGVPGDPAHPGQTVVRLGFDDGALGVIEWGRQSRAGEANGPEHWGLGFWAYTRLSESRGLNDPQLRRNQGAYALWQSLLQQSGATRSLGFVRAGVAHHSVNQVDLAFDLGLLVEHPFANSPSVSAWLPAPPESFTVGVALAHYGNAYREAQQAAGSPLAASELVLELGMRWLLGTELVLQPLVQQVWRPGGRAGEASTLLGLRLEWSLGPH